ncbi:hypothetical protein ACQPZJ_06810 [Actinoplanes sp. CA-054009]
MGMMAVLRRRRVLRRFESWTRPAAMTPERTEESLAYLTQVLGRWHPDTAEARLKVRYWLVADGDPTAAQRSAEAEAADRTAEFGAEHLKTFEARRSLHHFYREAHGRSAALPLIRALADDMSEALGPTHRETLSVRRHLAYQLRDEELLTESIVVSSAMLAELEDRPYSDKDLRATWFVLASALEYSGDREQALVYVQKELRAERSAIYGVDENIGQPYQKTLEAWQDRLRRGVPPPSRTAKSPRD